MTKIKHLYYENKIFRYALKLIILTLASAVYGVGIACFIDANSMATGGLIGAAIIISKIIPVSVGIMYLIFNIPILIYGFYKFGKVMMISTFYCIIVTTVFIDWSKKYIGALTHDPWLGCLVGGIIVGAAMGYIFKVGSTTGGIDIITKALRLKYQYIKTGVIFGIIDVTIVSLSSFIFKNANSVLYGLISVIVMSLSFDFVLYGRDGAKLIYVISDKEKLITERFLNDMNIGVTKLKGEGAFSGKKKAIIMAVVKKNSVPKIETIIREEDPNAFTIISDATEIYGLGYKSIFAEKI